MVMTNKTTVENEIKKTRILLVYDKLTNWDLGPIKRELSDRYDDTATIQNVQLSDLEEYMKGKEPFDLVFFEDSIDKKEICKLINNNTSRLIKGVSIKDDEVIKFIYSL